ncbi:MAG: membrane integrity-associated transporter subunit PqiC [Deltaproteobacteria bacterium]|jgi:uncharacterized lipoprotein YmbA|nr:membrane integrity-associated transporter subunit PqiC [Deltaproteobacteria bacterium]MBW2541271.1 membrane integrity-associated transporter subunit PqiC [Deltaproteobacteria bacterium]
MAAIAAASLALSCLGSSPNVSLYTMNAVTDSPIAGDPDGVAIGVGPIRVPRYLDRPQWVTRSAGSTSRLEVNDFRRWAGGFSSNVLSVLGENLGAKLGTQRVVVYPVQAPFPLDYRIAVDFHAFEGIGGEALELRANWVIRAGSGEGGPWSGQSTMRRSIAGGGPDALVAAHNEALDLLADAIAARIESLPKIDTASEGSDGQPSD